jgi:hypothetical protein
MPRRSPSRGSTTEAEMRKKTVRKKEPTRRRKRGNEESEIRLRTVLFDNDTGDSPLLQSM